MDTTKLLQLSARWGPSARTCIRLLKATEKQIAEWEGSVVKAALKAVSNPVAILGNLEDLEIDLLSHKILFIKRLEEVQRQRDSDSLVKQARELGQSDA